jgi:TRAP-type C4-dicarboxylate transport system permease small subunit
LSDSIISSIRNAVRFLEKRTSSLVNVLGAFSAVGLITMMMITVVDATGRRFFAFPIYGAYEGGSFLLSVVFFFSLCYCTAKKGHFAIDVVTARYPPRVRLFIGTIMYVVSALISWLLGSQLVVLAMKLKGAKLTGAQLTFVPIYILVLMGAFCLIATGWVFFVQFMGLLVETMEGND